MNLAKREKTISDFSGNFQVLEFSTDFSMDWEKLISEWIAYADLRSPRTQKTYLTALREFFKFLGQNQILKPNRENVIAWRKKLKAEGKSSATINSYLIGSRRFFEFLEEQKIYPNIFKTVKGEKISSTHKKDNLTEEQAIRLLESINVKSTQGKRDYAMIALMLSCGLRDIEVRRANVEDIRPLGDEVVLYVHGKGKSEKDDFVILPPEVEIAIRDYWVERAELRENSPIFVSTSNRSLDQRLSERTISKIVKTRFRNIGLNSKRLTAHSLRHTAATLNMMNGGTLEETQAAMRHKNIQTTMIYLHHIEKSKNTSTKRVAGLLFKKQQ
jgi:Site-specific recombinase XerD